MPQWTVRSLLVSAAEYLAAKAVATARLDAELLLAEVLARRRLDLYLEPDRAVTDDQRARLRELVRRRAAGEPVQYILGRTEFYGLEIACDRRAIVPRRETELLVDRALAVAGGRGVEALDLGTGTGCVACALAKGLAKGSRVTATDSSAEAVALARENAERLGLAGSITFVEGDLFSGLGDAGPFGLIAANLPYIPSAEIGSLMSEVRDREPRAALDGGPDGLEVIRRAAAAAPGHLAQGGWLLIEIGARQAREVERLLGEAGLEPGPTLTDPGGVERLAQGRLGRRAES
jgi:release factor glutamine methyltransferase